MDKNRYDFLTEPNELGYALVQDKFLNRVCIVEGDCVLHVTNYENNWMEYPKGTWQRPLQWLAPDRIGFFRDGYWGMMSPEGIVIIPDQFEFILPFYKTGYFILKNKNQLCGCVDKDFNILYPDKYEYTELRAILLKQFNIEA